MAEHVFIVFCLFLLFESCVQDQIVDANCRTEEYGQSYSVGKNVSPGKAIVCENKGLNKLPFLYSYKCNADETMCDLKDDDVKAM